MGVEAVERDSTNTGGCLAIGVDRSIDADDVVGFLRRLASSWARLSVLCAFRSRPECVAYAG